MHANASLAEPRSLLRVADAWRNGRALATLLITFVVVALVGLFCLRYASNATLSFALALCLVLAGIGVTAAGSQFAEQADGRPVSSVARALAATPRILLRVLLLTGLLSIVFVAFVLVAGAVLFACRLPVVGPMLYVVALPGLTLAGAVLLLAASAAALLSLPALWEGHSLRTVLSQLGAIAAQRKLEASANLILFFLVAGLVTAVVSAFVLAAFGLATSFPAPFSPATDIEPSVSALAGRLSLVDARPLELAATAGAALVFAITGALLAAVFLYGLAIAYLRSTEGIDIAAARAALGRAIVEVQVKRGLMAEDTKRFAGRMRALLGPMRGRAAPQIVAVPTGSAAAWVLPLPERSCAYCGSPAAHDDRFCGDCGRALSA